jgi:hypothetical protein
MATDLTDFGYHDGYHCSNVERSGSQKRLLTKALVVGLARFELATS